MNVPSQDQIQVNSGFNSGHQLRYPIASRFQGISDQGMLLILDL